MEYFAGIPGLSKEASSIFIWCLTQCPECYKQWVCVVICLFVLVFYFSFFFYFLIFFPVYLFACFRKYSTIFKSHCSILYIHYLKQDMLYLDNLDASVIVLKMLSVEWKEHSVKHASLDPLRETIKSFREKVTICDIYFLFFCFSYCRACRLKFQVQS